MSKCKPGIGIALANLESKGVVFKDANVEGTRVLSINIPYEALRDDKDVQAAFQDLLYIRIEPASASA